MPGSDRRRPHPTAARMACPPPGRWLGTTTHPSSMVARPRPAHGSMAALVRHPVAPRAACPGPMAGPTSHRHLLTVLEQAAWRALGTDAHLFVLDGDLATSRARSSACSTTSTGLQPLSVGQRADAAPGRADPEWTGQPALVGRGVDRVRRRSRHRRRRDPTIGRRCGSSAMTTISAGRPQRHPTGCRLGRPLAGTRSAWTRGRDRSGSRLVSSSTSVRAGRPSRLIWPPRPGVQPPRMGVSWSALAAISRPPAGRPKVAGGSLRVKTARRPSSPSAK